MAEKLATRLEKLQGEIHGITGIFRRAHDMCEDDLMDGEYYIDQLNKAVRKLTALSKKYEGISEVNTTTEPSKSNKEEEEDVKISGQSGGSVDLDNVFNLCFSIATAFDRISFMKIIIIMP